MYLNGGTQANRRLQAAAERVRDIDLVMSDVTPEAGRDVRMLWEDEGVQRVWANKVQDI